VQLHRVREVQREELEVRTPVGNLVEHVGRDELGGELDEAERAPEADTYDSDQGVYVGHVQSIVVWTERDARPELAVVGQRAPFLTDLGQDTEVVLLEEAEDVDELLVRKLLNRLLEINLKNIFLGIPHLRIFVLKRKNTIFYFILNNKENILGCIPTFSIFWLPKILSTNKKICQKLASLSNR